jgi:DNA repair protein RadD
MKLRPYQEEAVASIWNYFSVHSGNPLLALPTGCHAKGQRILMFDGSLRCVEDIKVGDLLMGPDSTPRTVLTLCRGRQEMRRIVPIKGESWVVNKDHILALYRCKTKNGSKYPSHAEKLVTQTVADFEQASKWHRHYHKLYRTAVTFQAGGELPLPPYFLGVFLGDGCYTQSQVGITSADEEIHAYCTSYMISIGDRTRRTNNGSKADTTYATTGIINRARRSETAKKLDLLGLRNCNCFSKYIPQSYKTASYESRLALLAGLMDTDGSELHGTFDYATVSHQLAEDILFVARSVGLAAYSVFKKNKYKGYYRISISGDCSKVPTLLPRKKAQPRRQKKNWLVTCFTVESLPEDNYYGFTLDKDHLYLLDDFTVTHNTGKSVIIAELLRRSFFAWEDQRVLVLTHVKELLAQNFEKLLALWPTAPAGIYSAGLKRRDTKHPILFGGIASLNNLAVEALGKIDLILIDECHLVSHRSETMYQALLQRLTEINPLLKVIGFTATPYRLGLGHMTDGGIFTDVCYDLTGRDAFNQLVADSYLAPLITKKTVQELDLSGVHIQGGEYVQSELQHAVDRAAVTDAAVQELIYYGKYREHWLVFASGIEHSQHVAECLNYYGIPAATVHSKCTSEERDALLADFRSGRIRALVNTNILTTGFDFPGIDLIGVLRPTASAVLWVQMLGRGTRPAENKENCLVLDFAGNTRRLGPINDPVMPRKKGQKGPGQAPVRVCDNCGTYQHASLRFCEACGVEFPRNHKLAMTAYAEEVVAQSEPVVTDFKVDRVTYSTHAKPGKPPSMQVSYYCGLRLFREYVCLEHDGYAGKKSREWWRKRAGEDPPETTAEAVDLAEGLPVPATIKVWVNTKYPEVLEHTFL